MKLNSLSARLIAAATLWAVVALVAAGLILVSLYRSTVESAFDQRLSVYLRTLVGSLSAQDPTQPFSDPGNLGEQRFELLYSGWYWQVRDAATHKVVLASGSLFSDTIDVSKATGTKLENGVTSGALVGPDKQSLRFLSRTVTFEKRPPAILVVAGDAGELNGQIASFGASVAITLAVFGIGLIAATLIQTRWGLRPLDHVRQALSELRSGTRTRIEGDLSRRNLPPGQGVERGS